MKFEISLPVQNTPQLNPLSDCGTVKSGVNSENLGFWVASDLRFITRSVHRRLGKEMLNIGVDSGETSPLVEKERLEFIGS